MCEREKEESVRVRAHACARARLRARVRDCVRVRAEGPRVQPSHRAHELFLKI